MELKNEMIKFVKDNFDVIKNNFLKVELEEILDDIDDNLVEFNMLVESLIEQTNTTDAEELINTINKRGIGEDLETEVGIFDLFNEIKLIKEK
jgi:hypothetical protein